MITMAQMPAVSQRLRRASAAPMAATVSGDSTSPSRVMVSSWSISVGAARQQRRHLRGEAADLAGAFDRAFQLADRPEIALDPFAHHRIGGGPHVELGIERAGDALDHHHGLLQQQQLRPRAHVEQAGDLEQQRQQLGHRDVFGGAVVDRLADGADRLREALHRMLARHIAGVEMHLRRAHDSRG